MPDDVTLKDYAEMVSGAAHIYRESVDNAITNLSPEQLSKILNILYVTTGLAGEAGEVGNKVKKILRDNNSIIDEEVRQKVLGELGGVAWYLTACAAEFNFRIEDVLNYNHKQITDRLSRGVVKGDGDNR